MRLRTKEIVVIAVAWIFSQDESSIAEERKLLKRLPLHSLGSTLGHEISRPERSSEGEKKRLQFKVFVAKQCNCFGSSSSGAYNFANRWSGLPLLASDTDSSESFSHESNQDNIEVLDFIPDPKTDHLLNNIKKDDENQTLLDEEEMTQPLDEDEIGDHQDMGTDIPGEEVDHQPIQKQEGEFFSLDPEDLPDLNDKPKAPFEDLETSGQTDLLDKSFNSDQKNLSTPSRQVPKTEEAAEDDQKMLNSQGFMSDKEKEVPEFNLESGSEGISDDFLKGGGQSLGSKHDGEDSLFPAVNEMEGDNQFYFAPVKKEDIAKPEFDKSLSLTLWLGQQAYQAVGGNSQFKSQAQFIEPEVHFSKPFLSNASLRNLDLHLALSRYEVESEHHNKLGSGAVLSQGTERHAHSMIEFFASEKVSILGPAQINLVYGLSGMQIPILKIYSETSASADLQSIYYSGPIIGLIFNSIDQARSQVQLKLTSVPFSFSSRRRVSKSTAEIKVHYEIDKSLNLGGMLNTTLKKANFPLTCRSGPGVACRALSESKGIVRKIGVTLGLTF